MSLIPRSGRGALGRFALGALIVVLFTATATAVAGLLQFKQFATDISVTPSIGHAPVTIADPGSPQTLLLIGSDHRAGEPFRNARTDTMMLVRIDPSSSTINVLSVPRDLSVQIPARHGTVTDKLNAAYAVGGPGLLVRVLRQQVFPGLRINHIIDVNFGGFRALVNAIGCVYTDVDHRYYNDTRLTNYSNINLQAGYQKLCGSDALDFVRFRHTDNDLVRNARQQAFLRWAKAQFSGSALLAQRDRLLKLFGHHTQTDQDLHSVDGLINLFNLVAFSAGHTIKQLHFPAILLACVPQAGAQTPCYVSATPAAEKRALDDFLTPTGRPSTPAQPAARIRRRARGGGSTAPAPDLVASGESQVQAAALGRVGMPVLLPRMVAAGSTYEAPTAGAYPRAYVLHDQRGGRHAAYRMVLVVNSALGQYYGVQGTTWQNPPILNSPNETRRIAGKQLALYFTGHQLAVVAWRTPHGAYWISNTLTADLSNAQMLGIAASLTRA